MRVQTLLSTSAAVVSLMAAGCSTDELAGPGQTDEPGMAAVCIAFAPDSPFAAAARTASVTVTASDMDDIVQSLTMGDSTVSGTVDRIPAGPARVFRIDVRDSTGAVAYQGRDTVDIAPGVVASVNVVVRKL